MLLRLLIFPQMAGSFSLGSSQVTESPSISCIRSKMSINVSNTLPWSFLLEGNLEIGLSELLWMMAVPWKISACMQILHKVRKLTDTDFFDLPYITYLPLSILFSPLVLEVTGKKVVSPLFPSATKPDRWNLFVCPKCTTTPGAWLEMSWELLCQAAGVHAWKSGFGKQWYQNYETQITTKTAF